MLGLVILTAFLVNAAFSVSQDFRHGRSFSFTADSPEDRIRHAQSQRDEGWQRRVELYTYFMENEIPLTPTIIGRHSLRQDPEAWRTEAVYVLFQARWALADGEFTQAQLGGIADAMDEAIRADDWLAFSTAQLDWYELVYTRVPSPESAVHLWSLRQTVAHGAYRGGWQHNLITEIHAAKINLLRLEDSAATLHIRDEIALGEYRLENGIAFHTFRGMETDYTLTHNEHAGIWRGFANTDTIGVLGVLLIIIAGSIIASEHTSGTIKILLINPVMRWKILLAKYAAVLTVGLGMLLLLFIANLLFAGLFFGFGGLGAPFLSVAEGEAVRGSSLLYMASRYLLGAVGMLTLATFAFAVSALVRSSALAIGLGVFLYFGGWAAVMILMNLGFYQARYILFANTDILAVINGTSGFVHHTPAFAVLNILVYMVVFLWTAWDAFVRADVK
jgi:ABC-type transport system involved in multi-copper enzyme maturation permease subunit